MFYREVQPLRVLGIDPGLTRCGVGSVQGVAGRPPELIDVGVVRSPAELDIARRLVLLEEGISAWISKIRPDIVTVERVFAEHNVQSVIATAQAAGVAMLCAARVGVPVALHSPSEVKAAVTGSGTAQKKQVGAMVTRILGLTELPKPADAADALAIAICQLWRGRTDYRDSRERPGVGAGSKAKTAGTNKGGRAPISDWEPRRVL